MVPKEDGHGAHGLGHRILCILKECLHVLFFKLKVSDDIAIKLENNEMELIIFKCFFTDHWITFNWCESKYYTNNAQHTNDSGCRDLFIHARLNCDATKMYGFRKTYKQLGPLWESSWRVNGFLGCLDCLRTSLCKLLP